MRKQLYKIALAATFGIALAFTFGCSSDDGDGGGVENGALKGSTWERNDSYTANSPKYSYTHTIAFKSDKDLTIKRQGYNETCQTYGPLGCTKYNKNNVNESTDYTYNYVPDERMGEYGGKNVFSISSDYKKLCLGALSGNCSNPYSRK